jgi:hypothetical protein
VTCANRGVIPLLWTFIDWNRLLLIISTNNSKRIGVDCEVLSALQRQIPPSYFGVIVIIKRTISLLTFAENCVLEMSEGYSCELYVCQMSHSFHLAYF